MLHVFKDHEQLRPRTELMEVVELLARGLGRMEVDVQRFQTSTGRGFQALMKAWQPITNLSGKKNNGGRTAGGSVSMSVGSSIEQGGSMNQRRRRALERVINDDFVLCRCLAGEAAERSLFCLCAG